MDSLVGYGSDEDHENERYEVHNKSSVSHSGGGRRRDDDTNYDDVNMDMSEDSQAESEPELPPAEPAPRADPRADLRHGDGKHTRGRSKSRERSADKRRDERDRRDRPDKQDRYNRSERERRHDGSSRRGPPADRPGRPDRPNRPDRPERPDRPDRPDDRTDKIPPVVEARGGEPAGRSLDARDAVSPRFVDRDRRDRERDRDRHARRSEEKRGGRERYSERSRSRSREARERRAAFPPPEPSVAAHSFSSGDRRISPATTDYRPSSYKVNRKLEVIEKMGLQIKTPDGSMATAQQLRQAACDALPAASGAPSFFNPTGMHANKILDQVQKRKLLWSGKNKSEAEEAAKWSGTRFAQDSDGKQVSKFMRLMGIKEPAVVKPEAPDKTVDPIKKQEELFQAMQQQYEVARATTHTMRGVGLGFQRGQY